MGDPQDTELFVLHLLAATLKMGLMKNRCSKRNTLPQANQDISMAEQIKGDIIIRDSGYFQIPLSLVSFVYAAYGEAMKSLLIMKMCLMYVIDKVVCLILFW